LDEEILSVGIRPEVVVARIRPMVVEVVVGPSAIVATVGTVGSRRLVMEISSLCPPSSAVCFSCRLVFLSMGTGRFDLSHPDIALDGRCRRVVSSCWFLSATVLFPFEVSPRLFSTNRFLSACPRMVESWLLRRWVKRLPTVETMMLSLGTIESRLGRLFLPASALLLFFLRCSL